MIRFEIFQWFQQTFLTKWTGSNIYHLLLAFFYSRVEVEIRHNKKNNFIFMFLFKGQVFARGRCDHTQRTPSFTSLFRVVKGVLFYWFYNFFQSLILLNFSIICISYRQWHFVLEKASAQDQTERVRNIPLFQDTLALQVRRSLF